MVLPIAELEELMQKEMSRKEFLRIVGAGMLGLIGISGLIQSIHKFAGSHVQQASRGYGSSPYGR